MEAEPKPTLFYTDIGRDIDDLEALLYAVASSNIELAGIVTTHMIPHRRARIAQAVLHHLGVEGIPIGVGSTYPLGREGDREMLKQYIQDHSIDGELYEGKGILTPAGVSGRMQRFPSGATVIHNAIEKYKDLLHIAALAPMTDLAIAADQDEKHFRQIGGICMQGGVLITSEGRLRPDPKTYNMKEDMLAAERIFALQDHIRFTVVGRHAAYQVPLFPLDFEWFRQTGHPVGDYLWTHAINGLEAFKKRSPEVYKRVFALQMPDGMPFESSMPYDLLAIMAIAHPRVMSAIRFDHLHAIIGSSEDQPGVSQEQKDIISRHIFDTLQELIGKSIWYKDNEWESQARKRRQPDQYKSSQVLKSLLEGWPLPPEGVPFNELPGLRELHLHMLQRQKKRPPKK